jgi:hypothetical protein
MKALFARQILSLAAPVPTCVPTYLQNMLPHLGGYLCEGSKINLARCEQFIQVGP